MAGGQHEQDILSPEQVNYISIALFLALFPISLYMYTHWQSMRRRFLSYPVAEVQGAAGKKKIS